MKILVYLILQVQRRLYRPVPKPPSLSERAVWVVYPQVVNLKIRLCSVSFIHFRRDLTCGNIASDDWTGAGSPITTGSGWDTAGGDSTGGAGRGEVSATAGGAGIAGKGDETGGCTLAVVWATTGASSGGLETGATLAGAMISVGAGTTGVSAAG